ncbi:MAG: cyclase family protein [Halieaceae bacterium]|nr:cyclase family protein [Halieaceae bacterium]MBT5133879.1 cyclase family protein [Halieaceae bacterium]MBT5557273.1 cyclase family protein [Halieaceae bacterium]MBT6180391.1 cyclase family protein [Halieaceae bacterium]
MGAAADECMPSPWGADDQIGAANRITTERTATAAQLVKKGESHPLGIVIEPGMPAYPPRYTQLQVVQPLQQFNADLGVGWDASSNDDVLQMWLGTGPQIDGLGHMGEAGEFYNCNQGKDFSVITGLTKLDISGIPPLVGRGVLIDMAKQMGVAHLAAGQPITSDDIKAAMKAQNIVIGEGDIVLLHTGYTDAKLQTEPQLWAASIPGITNEAAVFLASLKPTAVGADTWGLGAVPPRPGDKIFYDHVVLLKQNGIYILETMNTGRLAEEAVHEFMFVLGQARLKGAVQMIINPVAMW